MRRAGAPLALAVRRLAARPGGPLLTGIGVAIGAAALAAVLVSNTVVEDRAVADAVSRLPAAQRVVSVSWVAPLGQALGDRDEAARRALASLELGESQRAVAFRTTRLGGRLVRLAAFDRASRVLEPTSGRMPRPCSSGSCELVVLDAPRIPAVGKLGVVGSASARRDFPVERYTGTPSAAAPVLVADGVGGLSARPEVSGLFRTVTWAVALQPDRLDADTVAGLPARIAELDTGLRVQSGEFAIDAPLEDLRAAAERAKVASRRQLLVAGAGTALFLAFVVLAAARIRRGVGATAFRLRRLGGRRWQVALENVAYVALIAVPAVLLGWCLGIAGGALVAGMAGEPAGDVVRRSVLRGEGLAVLLAAMLVATVALVATVQARTLEVRGRSVGAVDVAIVGVLAVLATAVLLGETDSAALARGGGTGSVLLSLPILIALAGALLTARLLGPVLRLAERALPAGPTSLRLAFLSLARNAGPAAVTVASLAVTAAMAVFAFAYDATLDRNQQDAAGFAVPLDYVVARDDTRAQAFATRDLAQSYADPVGVVRRTGEAPSLNRRERLTMLGIPAGVIPELRWRDDFSTDTPEELSRAIAFDGGGLRGVPIPAAARELVFPRTVRGDPVRITASIQRPDGGFATVDLAGETADPDVRGKLPANARGGKLVALALGFPPGEEFTAAHRATGSDAVPDVFVRGTLRLGRPFAITGRGRQPLPLDYRDWVLADGSAGSGGSASSVRIRYFLSQERAFRIRPRQPTDGQPIPVIASRSLADLAGDDAVIPIRVGQAELRARIVDTARRFPTLRGDFLVADRAALEMAANAVVPGTAVPDEVWLRGPPGEERELRAAAPLPVRVASRDALAEELRGDSVSRGVSLALVATALLAAVLAIVGLLLTIAVDVRDNRPELFDLETLGVDPAGLARHVWLRLALVLAAGLVAGLLTGVAMAFLVTDIVAVTANLTEAEPPIRIVVDWPALLLGIAVFAVGALAAAALIARSQFRDPAPDRPSTT